MIGKGWRCLDSQQVQVLDLDGGYVDVYFVNIQ